MFGRFIAIALLAASGFAAPAPCPLRHPVAPVDTLPDLASFYFGSTDFAPAILMATNSRVSEGFSYISNPFRLRQGSVVCIPDAGEAERSRSRYETFQQAVAGMTVTQPWEIANNALVVIPPGQSVTVATWTRAGIFNAGTNIAPGDIWVSVEPHLQEFCRQFFQESNYNQDELTLRLEQRLGLPPANGATTFTRFQVASPDSKTIFRPCSDPATDIVHCEAGPPSGNDPAYTAWFTGHYYSSYGLPRPNFYPWTALGYTFDWAQGSDGQFNRIGESEFVIPKGAPIQVLGVVSTEAYCR